MSFSCPTGHNDNKASITCSGPSSSQFSCAAELISGSAPGDLTAPSFANCEPYHGIFAKKGHPLVVIFNIW